VIGYDFARARRQWARIPVDDVGYLSARDLLRTPEHTLAGMAQRFERARYEGERNHEGRWRRCLGLDNTHGKTVLDFGCGFGIEALQFARAGNDVILADINWDTVLLARRVLRLHGLRAAGASKILGGRPFVEPGCELDVFYANGVLHHTPDAPAILARAAELLAPEGEVRLLLYTDRGWTRYVGTPAPLGDPREDVGFVRFLRSFDQVGDYAEPWWADKLAVTARDAGLELRSWDYITSDDRYAAAVLACA
jgi:SAM-dependent methyltransferase